MKSQCFNEALIREDQEQRISHNIGVADDGSPTGALEDFEESTDLVDSVTTDDIRQANLSNNSHYSDMLMIISGIRGLEQFFGYGNGVKFVQDFIAFLNAEPSPYFRETIFSLFLEREAPSPERMAILRGCERQNTSGDIIDAIERLEKHPRFGALAKQVRELRASSFAKTFRKKTERIRGYKRIKEAKYRVDIYSYRGTKLAINDTHYVNEYVAIEAGGKRFLSYNDLQTKKDIKVEDRNCRLYTLPDNRQIDGNKQAIVQPKAKSKVSLPTIKLKLK